MSQATEYDTDDSGDLLQRPQRMYAAQKNRVKNFMKVVVSSSNDQSAKTSSTACSTVDFKVSSTTHSSAEEKSQIVQLPLPWDDGESSTSSTASAQESPSPPHKRKYVELPAGYLPQYDDCDEVEKLARKKRCDELISLSAKIVQEAKEAANRRPLKWAEPTFSPFSSSDTSKSPTVTVSHQGKSNSGRQPTSQKVQDISIQSVPASGKRRRNDS